MTAHYLDRICTPDPEQKCQEAAEAICKAILTLKPGEALTVERPEIDTAGLGPMFVVHHTVSK